MNLSNNNDLYSDGGFPFIRLSIKENIEEDKKKREFGSKNIMSIQNILNKRRQLDDVLSKRAVNNDMFNEIVIPSEDSESSDQEIKFNFNTIVDNHVKDISNLNVKNLIKNRRSISKKGSKKGSKIKSKN